MKDKVVKYVKSLDPALFNQEALKNVKVTKVTASDFNLNFFVKVDRDNYVVKVNINNPFLTHFPTQSMLAVEQEILKYINNVFGPKVYHVDVSKKDFPHDLLIYEQIQGTTPRAYEKQVLINIAKVMSVIHSIDTEQMKAFLPTRSPFDNFELFTSFLKDIKKTKHFAVISQYIAKARHELYNNKSLFTNINYCFIHYALHLDNIIFDKEKIKLLDWNLCCKGDKAEDIALVFSLANVYLRKPLDQKMRALFLEQFTLYGDDRTLTKRLKVFEFLTSLYVVCLLYKLLYSPGTPKEILSKNRRRYEASLKYGIDFLKKNY